MVAWSMIPQFVVGVHPISFIVEVFETYYPVVQFSGAVPEQLVVFTRNQSHGKNEE